MNTFLSTHLLPSSKVSSSPSTLTGKSMPYESRYRNSLEDHARHQGGRAASPQHAGAIPGRCKDGHHRHQPPGKHNADKSLARDRLGYPLLLHAAAPSTYDHLKRNYNSMCFGKRDSSSDYTFSS
ncbi:hypothetical protein KCU65_g462, partial [Aureobasidium melanogenum]